VLHFECESTSRPAPGRHLRLWRLCRPLTSPAPSSPAAAAMAPNTSPGGSAAECP
jgi:hypothetical protein